MTGMYDEDRGWRIEDRNYAGERMDVLQIACKYSGSGKRAVCRGARGVRDAGGCANCRRAWRIASGGMTGTRRGSVREQRQPATQPAGDAISERQFVLLPAAARDTAAGRYSGEARADYWPAN